MPFAKLAVVKVACAPELPALSVAVPNKALPSIKVTVPLGVPLPLLLTVAVSVTDWPGAAEVADEDKDVVVLVGEVWPTACAKEALLTTKVLSPL